MVLLGIAQPVPYVYVDGGKKNKRKREKEEGTRKGISAPVKARFRRVYKTVDATDAEEVRCLTRGTVEETPLEMNSSDSNDNEDKHCSVANNNANGEKRIHKANYETRRLLRQWRYQSPTSRRKNRNNATIAILTIRLTDSQARRFLRMGYRHTAAITHFAWDHNGD